MFSNMLRPSRRHAHERVSQHEDNVVVANSNDSSESNTSDRQSSDPSIVVIGGGGENTSNGNEPPDLNNNLEGGAEGGGVGGGGESPGGGSNARASDSGNNSNNNSNNSNNNNESSSSTATNNANQSSDDLQYSSDESDDAEEPSRVLRAENPTTHPFLTSQIRTERELRYRRQSTCTLLLLFFLMRLWIEAIIKKDIGLVFLSVMGTTWTYRWYVSRREAEDEYDRQIVDGERSNNGRNAALSENAADGEGATGADAAINFDPDLGLMSFQAQLALAILESQRQMFENGGYGGNDRPHSDDGPGVTSEAKEKWKRYEWGNNLEETAKLGSMIRSSSQTGIKRTTSAESNYGSVSTALTACDEEDTATNINYEESLSSSSPSKLEEGNNLLDPTKFCDIDDEEPSCSICLCEYEPGENVLRLPCDHVYHESCLNSWTENHVRCPLCNYDLMEGFEQPASVRRAQRESEEQRAFRNMALSTLGRRIRTRRSAAGGGRRTSRASAAAAMVAAAEDSIV